MLGRYSILGARGSLLALLLLTFTQPLLGLPSQDMTAPVSAEPYPASSVRERWIPPLARSIEVVGPYRAPPHKYGSGHRGIDLPAAPGERVLAPASGTVVFAGTVVDRGTVTVRIDERTVVSIEPVSATVAVGTEVQRGALIGTVSSGGHCAAECVHVGVRIEGEYTNPMRFFAGRPVLLPWTEG